MPQLFLWRDGTDMGASGARRRTLQRQNREAAGVGGVRGPLQTSASLPETPVFARGCDVPRTPPRNSTGPPRNTVTSGQSIGKYYQNCLQDPGVVGSRK